MKMHLRQTGMAASIPQRGYMQTGVCPWRYVCGRVCFAFFSLWVEWVSVQVGGQLRQSLRRPSEMLDWREPRSLFSSMSLAVLSLHIPISVPVGRGIHVHIHIYTYIHIYMDASIHIVKDLSVCAGTYSAGV